MAQAIIEIIVQYEHSFTPHLNVGDAEYGPEGKSPQVLESDSHASDEKN